jgi:hypothetical protein
MALLNRGRLRPSTWIPLVLMAISAGGCMLFSGHGAGDPPLAFNHAVHVKEGLECTDCHAGAADSDQPGMPGAAQCQLCHANLDKDKPPEKRVASLFTDGNFRALHATKLSSEVIFSHSAHVGRGTECASCHKGIETSTRIQPEMHIGMDACNACHAAKTSEKPTAQAAGQDCATCHREIRKDVKPATHEHTWIKMHGQTVRGGGGALADRCSLCHTESTCTTCHTSQAPQNHDNFWRIRGHGIAAEVDRVNCMACHRPDSCERCHADTLPLSHAGTWGAPMDTHCLSCHFPLQGETCVVCHKGMPSHQTAAPMPPWHNPGMNCRQCHGVTQPLPHVDNGSTCTTCHH